ISTHCQRVNFECHLTRANLSSNFAAGLALLQRLYEKERPLVHAAPDPVAYLSGPVVKLQRRGGKKAAPRKHPSLRVQSPALTKHLEPLEPACSIGGTNHLLDKDPARLVHHRALQFFL